MPNKERWLSAPGFEGYYEISCRGRVRRASGKNKGHIRIPCATRTGYLQLILSVEGEHFSVTVHSMVAKAFIPNPEHLPQVNHKNGKKTDNRKENLEWTTARGNRIHARDMGLHKPAHGRGCWNAKLSDKAVADIRRRWIPYKVTLDSLAAEYGVSASLLSMVVNRVKWKHVH